MVMKLEVVRDYYSTDQYGQYCAFIDIQNITNSYIVNTSKSID